METRRSIKLRRQLPLVWLLLLLLAAILLPDQIWNTLLIGLGGLFVVAYIWAWRLSKGLSGRRRLHFGWVAVGDRLSEQFELGNRSALPAFWVEVVDSSNVPGYQAAIVRSVGATDINSWRQTAICKQRGQFRLGPWSLRTSDPFGIFHVAIDYEESEEIIIHPPIHAEIPISLPAGQSSGQVRARERAWQATINAAGVRDYLPHDPLSWIHWPTTARRDSLFVRNFDLDAAGDIWLLLDLEASIQLGDGPEGTEEHTVLLAAALSALGRRQNRPIGLAAYGQEPTLIPPGRGRGHEWRLLRALALVEADGQSGLSPALADLARVAQRGSAAVIITPSGRAEWLPNLLALAQRGIQATVILLNRASFGPEPGSSNGGSQGLRNAIRSLGIDSALVRQGEVGRPIVEEERRGFWNSK